ncbi:DUF484 family protein [Vibrio rarus]|uniref:DUF484 family protein n=1 Tax=Vibrio rarus TaxID=413403 RepID=UPI0021C2F6F4|nr:DUF484 family protein [Vibrio rarus]
MDSTAKEYLSPADIEQFLLDNPDFFVGREHLVDSLTIPHQRQGAVSLFELQRSRLREQVQQLADQKNELMAVTQRNDGVFRQFMALEKRVMRVHNAEQLMSELQHQAAELDLKVVIGVVGHSYAELALKQSNWALFSENNIADKYAYLGRIKRSDRELIFKEGTPVSELGSYAVIPFEHPNIEGFLCFCSEDGSRFQPSQDTLYLNHLAMVIAYQLNQLQWQKVATLHVPTNI